MMKLHGIAFGLLCVLGLGLLTVDAGAQASAPAATADPAGLVSRPVPNAGNPATSPYVRPTESEKFRAFVFNVVGPEAIVDDIAGGAIQQAYNSPPEWGQGADSFGVRTASNAGILLVTEASHYGLAEVLREDVEYYPCECKGLFRRFGHAVISTVIARRGQDGHKAFSFSGLASPYVGTMVAMSWYPPRFGPKDGFRLGNYNLLAQAAKNAGIEFVYGGPQALFGKDFISRFFGKIRSGATGH